MICEGSGVVLGGYRKDLKHDTFETTCIHCWKQIDVEPIDPEPRTDLRIDGSLVMVIRKRMIDHEFGNVLAMRWRRDVHRWLFWLSIAMCLISVIWLLVDYLWR